MLEYWFMFPMGIVIATIAMMSGIGGAVLFSPFLMVVLGVEPLLALAAGLCIEVFGFSSGLIGYLRLKSINFTIGKKLLVLTIPAALFGVLFARFVPAYLLKILLAGLLIYLAYNFLKEPYICRPKHPVHTGKDDVHQHKMINLTVGQSSVLGALLLGMISTGLGEINEYNFLKRMRMSVASASGTSVFLVAFTALVGFLSHITLFIVQGNMQIFYDAIPLLAFTVPGVIIGAQLGVHFAKIVNPEFMSKFVGVLFLVVSAATMSLVF